MLGWRGKTTKGNNKRTRDREIAVLCSNGARIIPFTLLLNSVAQASILGFGVACSCWRNQSAPPMTAPKQLHVAEKVTKMQRVWREEKPVGWESVLREDASMLLETSTLYSCCWSLPWKSTGPQNCQLHFSTRQRLEEVLI